ncbi:hypothetical protein [Catellatospora sp. NPDC049609]|uniref:hypothetical protein n=1 Tax=Catellatospora sp. NPDC049609 TaxID=3155505 RepID=UPI0034428A67
MGVGTVDALLNGRLPVLNWYKASFTAAAAGSWFSPMYVNGLPGPGTAPSAGVNGTAVSNGRSGTLAAPTAVAGRECYLNAVDMSGVANVAQAVLIDRMWENSGLSVTSTALQSIPAPVALPARDANKSTLGVGVEIGIEITATLGSAAPILAFLTYTDSDGTPLVSAWAVQIPTAAPIGTFLPFGLAAGDYGIRVPTAFQLASSLVSGSLSLVMYRRLGRAIPLTAPSVPGGYGPADGGGPVADGCAPQFLYLASGTAGGITSGSAQFVQA